MLAKVIQYTAGMSNGFFVIDREIIAVDGGGEFGKDVFLKVCMDSNIDPKSIKLLIVTHGHVDHFVNIGNMKELTGAPILCHKEAAPFLRDGLYPIVQGRNEIGREILKAQERSGEPFPFVPKVGYDIVFEGVYVLNKWGVSGKVIETPGHSKCSTAVILDSGEAIVGDTVVEIPGNRQIGLAFLSDADDTDDLLFKSVQAILDSAHTIYSGHGGPFTREEAMKALVEEKKD